MSGSTELTRILVSKLCHDLSGSIGAAGNAVDFLESENPDVRQKALDLISFSVTQAISDLKFFREVYGVFKQGEDVSLDEIKRLSDFFVKHKGRIFVDFRVSNPDSQISGEFGRLILCFLPIAAGALVGDGKIKVEIASVNGGVKASICAIGKEVKVNNEISNIFFGRSHAINVSASNAHYIYTRMLMTDMDVEISINKSEDSVEYMIFNVL